MAGFVINDPHIAAAVAAQVHVHPVDGAPHCDNPLSGVNAQGRVIPAKAQAPFQVFGDKAALGQLFLHMADKPAGGLGQPGKAVLFPAGEQLHASHVFLGIGLYQPLYTAQELLLGPLPPFLRWKPEDSLEKVVHQCAVLKHIHLSPAALLGVQAIAAEVLKPALVIGLHLGGGQKQLFPKKLPGQRFVLQPGQPLARGPLQGLHPSGIGRVPRKKQPQGPGLSIAGRKAGRQPGEGRFLGVGKVFPRQAAQGQQAGKNGQEGPYQLAGGLVLPSGGTGPADIQPLCGEAGRGVGQVPLLHGALLQGVPQGQLPGDQLLPFRVGEHPAGLGRQGELPLSRPNQEHRPGRGLARLLHPAKKHLVHRLGNFRHILSGNHLLQQLKIPLAGNGLFPQDGAHLVQNLHKQVPNAQLLLGQGPLPRLLQREAVGGQVFLHPIGGKQQVHRLRELLPGGLAGAGSKAL